MDKNDKDKIVEKALDIGDLILAVGAIFAGRELIGQLLDLIRNVADSTNRRLNMWRHHDLPVYVRRYCQTG